MPGRLTGAIQVTTSTLSRLTSLTSMEKYYFTFGSGHYDANHTSLGHMYTTIEASTEAEAREKMFELRGQKWSMSCDAVEARTAVFLHHLTYLLFQLLTPQPGETR